MPVRKIPKNYRNLTGVLASTKSTGPAQFESTLERDFLSWCEFSPEVQSFEVQPVTIEWRNPDAGRRIYTPDVQIIFSPDTQRPPWLCEVKYRADLQKDWATLHPKFLKAIRYAKERGWRFRLITEIEIRTVYLDNIRFLLPFRSRNTSDTEVGILLDAIPLGKHVTPASLLLHISPDKYKQAELLPIIWHLISHHRIGTNLRQPLTMDSPIWRLP